MIVSRVARTANPRVGGPDYERPADDVVAISTDAVVRSWWTEGLPRSKGPCRPQAEVPSRWPKTEGWPEAVDLETGWPEAVDVETGWPEVVDVETGWPEVSTRPEASDEDVSPRTTVEARRPSARGRTG